LGVGDGDKDNVGVVDELNGRGWVLLMMKIV
jgi:hypothetical protein